jgi:Tol biopolymer transport system component
VTRALLLAVACAACGRLEFGARDDAAPIDAPLDAAAPCRTWGAFSAPQLVENINAFGMGNDDWHPSLTADDLTLYFYSFRSATLADADIWRATRPAVGQPFAIPERVADVSSPSYDWSPNLTADGLSLVFASNRPGGTGDFDFYEARRPDPSASFDAIDELKALNTTLTEDTAWISPDGLRVYFSSNRGTSDDIWFASRVTRLAQFSSGQLLTELSTPSFRDQAPGLSADELDIFFSSARGTTGFDIWHATRLAIDQPFAPPQPIPILNSANDDFAPSLSHDGSELYYSYDALAGGGGDANIFVAKRACLD